MSNQIEGKTALEWFNLGLENKNSGNYQNAIECFKKVVKLEPNNKDAWLNLGACYEQLANYQKTIECYDNADKLK
ncbi:MAG: tetratricopeptide repeat protein [Candidatus Helarchaeota archaeon]